MTLSLSLSLPGISSAEFEAPLFRRRQVWALKDADGNIPQFNPFYNPNTEGDIQAGGILATRNDTVPALQIIDFQSVDPDDTGAFDLLTPNSQTLYWGASTSSLRFRIREVGVLASADSIAIAPTGDRDSVLSQAQIDDVSAAELIVIIPNVNTQYFDPTQAGWQVSTSAGVTTFAKTNTDLPIAHDSLVGQQFYIWIGQRSNTRPEAVLPNGWFFDPPDDPENRGLVSVYVTYRRNGENEPGFGPVSERTTELDTYYASAISLPTDHSAQRAAFRFDSDRVTFDSDMHTFDEDV